MRRNYRFAGIELSVHMPDEKMYENEYRLEPFGVGLVNDPQEYVFELTDRLDGPEGVCNVEKGGYCIYQDGGRRIRYVGSVGVTLEGAYIRVCSEGKKHHVQLLAEKFPDRVGTKTVLNSIDVQHLLAIEHGFILHCSYIERDGRAILFTAPSETGKSTQAELWSSLKNTEIINGDRAAVRLVDREILAEGIPFAGSSKYCKNRTLPVEAIVYLGQAPKTSIERLRGYQAFAKIWEGVSVNSWDKEDVERVSAIVQEIAARVPVYHLSCTPDESAVIALENALKERESV